MILETPYEMAMNTAKRFRKVRTAKKITIHVLVRRTSWKYWL